MDTQEHIVQYLRDQYHPAAIILHGSRAIGMQRPHSDWDIFLLFMEEPKQQFWREEIGEADVEWKACRRPASNAELLAVFDSRLMSAKLLWEQDSAGTALLEQAARIYERGIQLTPAYRRRYGLFLRHKVRGMADDIDSPYLYARHLGEFLLRSVTWWYELRGMYDKPKCVTLSFIQAADPEYHALLMTLCGDGARATKLAAAQEIVVKIFPENR